MPLTLNQIRDNCQKARACMQRAGREHFALGAFNLDNQETLIAVARAAANKKAPVLVEVSQGEVEAMGLDNIRDMVENYKKQYSLEMYVNLDHSPCVADALAGITAGYEFIHIDISQADHAASDQEIIAKTKQVVAAAKLTGALVEAEPHYFAGSSNVHNEPIDYGEVKKTFTTPEAAKAFVAATGVDTFAAAVGNLHGLYSIPKVLDLKLLIEIRQALDCNISLHGGSGTPAHYFKEAVKIGVTKVNINSDLRRTYRLTLEKALAKNKTEFAVIKLMGEVIEAVQKVVEKKIDMFGSGGRARPF